jgi:transcriptional regulator with XRE-family HTH domain
MIQRKTKPCVIAPTEEAKIGARLRAARLEAKMSQEKLAAALGVTFQQIQKYENGRNRIASSRLAEAARVLKKPIAYFVGSGVAAPEGQYLIERMLGVSGGADLARAFLKLDTAKARRRAIDRVEEIVA